MLSDDARQLILAISVCTPIREIYQDLIGGNVESQCKAYSWPSIEAKLNKLKKLIKEIDEAAYSRNLPLFVFLDGLIAAQIEGSHSGTSKPCKESIQLLIQREKSVLRARGKVQKRLLAYRGRILENMDTKLVKPAQSTQNKDPKTLKFRRLHFALAQQSILLMICGRSPHEWKGKKSLQKTLYRFSSSSRPRQGYELDHLLCLSYSLNPAVASALLVMCLPGVGKEFSEIDPSLLKKDDIRRAVKDIVPRTTFVINGHNSIYGVDSMREFEHPHLASGGESCLKSATWLSTARVVPSKTPSSPSTVLAGTRNFLRMGNVILARAISPSILH